MADKKKIQFPARSTPAVLKLLGDGLVNAHASICAARIYAMSGPGATNFEQYKHFSVADPIGSTLLDSPETYLGYKTATLDMKSLSIQREAVMHRVSFISEAFSPVRKISYASTADTKWPKSFNLGLATYTYSKADTYFSEMVLLYLSSNHDLDLERLALLRNDLTHDITYRSWGNLWFDVMADDKLVEQTLKSIKSAFNDTTLVNALISAQPNFTLPAIVPLTAVSQAAILGVDRGRNLQAARDKFKS